MRFWAGLFFTCAALAGAGFAAPTPSGLPVPRFVSLKFAEVNGRAGPSEQHPVLWEYHRRGLPVMVVAETENWRRVRDPEGVLVWMHKRTLDGRHTAIATAEAQILARPAADAAVAAVAEPGVIVTVKSCRDGWLRVTAGDFKGWARPDAFWGASCGEGPQTAPDAQEGADLALQAGLR